MRRLLLRLRNRGLRHVLAVVLRPTSRTDLVRLGSDYGGWWVPKDAVGPGTVAYCGGAGEDITFDLALHEAGCTVRTFDPTPRAVAHVQAVAPESDRFRFLPVGWWSEASHLRLYAPRDSRHVSHSALNLQRTEEYFEATVKPISMLMSELGDEQVDLVKMDIEGAEYEVLDAMLREGPLPRTLCVEFDQPVTPRRTVAAVRRLRTAGYRLERMEHFNCTFTRTA